MVADVEGARRWANWGFERQQPGWIRRLCNSALVLAAAGPRAVSALPLRNSRGAAAGWFNVSVTPIAGRPGYSFWNFQDITARHEMEAVIHDERNKLVDFLDNAPIGFYSVDGNGRFLFVNQTLAPWPGRPPAATICYRAPPPRFPASPPGPRTAG